MTSIVRFWIWFSALASAAGWLLSALGRLNGPGYAVFAGLALAVWIWIRRRSEEHGKFSTRSRWRSLRRRFRRFLPLSFAVLALLVLVGGLLYAPSNHTGLSYRVPRVLHWMAEGQWHWIHSPNYRLNNRACGIEWLSAPLLIFLKSDRALFLLNFFPFLLLPGLVFSLFTRLGVRARVAWHWMWLLPTGYTFLLQAGSIGNDTFPTVYALAAVDFACRAWTTRRVSDVFASVLAAALLTGAKASNVPLLLPWVFVVAGVWRLLLRRPLATGLVMLLALAASFAPTAILNVIHCGDWSGLVLERRGMDMKSPLVGIMGNGLLLLSNNFVPPLFPLAGWYNQSVLSLMPGFIVGPMSANFEQGYEMLWELPTEDWAGVGFGVSALAAVSVVVALRRGAGWSPVSRAAAAVPELARRGAVFGAWVALLAYCVKSGMVTPARLISPYYPMLLPLLLLWAGQSLVVRRQWWRWAEVAVVLMASGVLVVTPARPLWPAQTMLAKLTAVRPESGLARRAAKVYSVYASRSDPLAEVRARLPKDISTVGFIATGDDMDISLWRPYGTRRVEHFTLDDPVDVIHGRRVQYVVLGGLNLAMENRTVESWLQKTGGELVSTVQVVVKVNEGPQPWYIVRIP